MGKLCYLLVFLTSLNPPLPRIGEGNRLHVSGASTSPPFWCFQEIARRDVSPGLNFVRWVLVVVRQTSFCAVVGMFFFVVFVGVPCFALFFLKKKKKKKK